jgi:CrcB protein
MSAGAWAAFLVAAGVGAPARYLVDAFVQDRASGLFPWGTLVVNVSGCLVLGVLTGLTLHHHLDPTARTVLGTGGLGAYTTFSTFTFETVRLAEEGAVDDALRNGAGSFLVGLAAAAAGLGLAALVAC